MFKIYCPYCGKEIQLVFEKKTRKTYNCKCNRVIQVIVADTHINQVSITTSFYEIKPISKKKWYKFWL